MLGFLALFCLLGYVSGDTPKTCAEILKQNSNAQSGVYTLKQGGGDVKAYCYMGEICGSKGWTMIMKIDGNKNTFRYESPYWANKNVFNVAGADGGLDNQETKLETYSTMSFNKLCVGMKTGSETRWLTLRTAASSLYSLIADGKYRPTFAGRDGWKGLIRGSSLQSYCNLEGFNVNPHRTGTRARIGILGNNENDCRSPDSRLGFGTNGNWCGQRNDNHAGNEARCRPDNGHKSIKSFGFIFAQEKVGGAPLGSYDSPALSCDDLANKLDAKSGVYYLQNGNSTAIKAYCYMEELCGSKGWTLIMKIDGSKRTFTYNSPYWTNTQGYNLAGADGGLSAQETKLQTYSTVPFNKLCLGMKTTGVTRWMPLRYPAESLHSLLADGKYKATHNGRDAWKGLIAGSSLQYNCNQEGFNVYTRNVGARIGIIGNDQNDCRSPDSRIGFGTYGSSCGMNYWNTAGNEARCRSDNGNKRIMSFGYILVKMAPRSGPLGSFDNPATSCRQIQANRTDAKSGVYYLSGKGKALFKAYCYMGEMCGSTGWTMIMKIDGSKTTFHYNSGHWTNAGTYNTAGADGGLDNTETKLHSYSMTPFDKLCLGFKRNGVTRWMAVEYKADSLHSLIADGGYRPTYLGRDTWKSVISGSSLQRHCNREGFNVLRRARIGIVANQENDCNSPDSRLGLGTAGRGCGQNDRNSAGNEARCSADNGDKSIMVFGYIFAQESSGVALLGSQENPAPSCADIKAARSGSQSGVYYLKRGQAVIKAYCYMEKMCGSRGWTMIMKIDGNKTTFSYNSPYWTNTQGYNLAGADGGLDDQETKLQTYSTVPFNKLCLGFKSCGETRWMSMAYEADSLHSIIADGKYRETSYGRYEWKKLIRASSLQRTCTREGFNVLNMARIGIVSSQDSGCARPESRLGLGTAGTYCNQDNQNSAGNEARCGSDNGDQSFKSFGYIFVKEQPEEAPLGSFERPASSCIHIRSDKREARSGVYYLKRGEITMKAYCYMEEICGSTGWTLVMKIDGNKRTFHYKSPYWTNSEVYNVAGAEGDLDNTETKLQTFSTVPFNRLCLGMKVGGLTRWMSLDYKANSLHSVIADNKYRATNKGRDAWKKLVSGSSLQPNCNREGFNVLNMARIGIVSNQENNCNSAESRIGFGTAGSGCGQNDGNSAGNEARCGGDNGNKSIKGFGYIFVQEMAA